MENKKPVFKAYDEISDYIVEAYNNTIEALCFTELLPSDTDEVLTALYQAKESLSNAFEIVDTWIDSRPPTNKKE